MKRIQVTVKKQQKIKDKGFTLRSCLLNQEKMSIENDQVEMNPIIKDLIINKEENTTKVKYGNQDSWGFQSTYDFFKEKNRQ